MIFTKKKKKNYVKLDMYSIIIMLGPFLQTTNVDILLLFLVHKVK